MRAADVMYGFSISAERARQRLHELDDGPAQTRRAVAKAEELAREAAHRERFGSPQEQFNDYAWPK